MAFSSGKMRGVSRKGKRCVVYIERDGLELNLFPCMTSTSFSLKPAFNRAKQTVDCQVIQNVALALKTRQSRKFPSVENDKLVAYQTVFPLR